ncbi:lysophospholipid acyltransferase family protein [Roseiconus lacunae]|uniref:Lysophospholipid acyltransferase family protein n=1 Tax=Roseiconus lacunae TaxID=2605694 RepID=A0ABT7PM10_9BACT|nr:lysophospholipid acyltransferase family protein [Roseiconus lacunae]MCD0462722.1 lysophospholipid acyltransferase family protein [Roseiconus lacunae]MDM4017191.1 lysophospholipid acyltransferase family protein [Roseiconus lacunae]WRQ51232.1 lysophospholipid acyltransferase family protein [Stieleria sp. HD01]
MIEPSEDLTPDVTPSASLSKPSPGWFLAGFQRFLRRYLRRHFHAVAVTTVGRERIAAIGNRPLIVYANHPSWWDPLIAHFLNETLLSPRHFFAPIDAQALQKYKVFEKLGFYGVQMSSKSGVVDFLNHSSAILDRHDAALWITPEGRFADARDHSVPLMPGLAHLCHKNATRGGDRQPVLALPLALEYVFWDERLPVCLANPGQLIDAASHSDWRKDDWKEVLQSRLRDAQAELADAAIARSSQPFENLLAGRRGAGWLYDGCRKLKAKLTGKPFEATHGEQFR